jgi:transcriptional regulator with XRE-family HTH domain
MGATFTATVIAIEDMSFPQRLAVLRKQQGLTQQALAERVGIHVTGLRRYEAGTAQPTLDVLRRIAVSLSVSADTLVFDDDERGPRDDDLRLRLEALDRLDDTDKTMVKAFLDAILLRADAKRWTRAS